MERLFFAEILAFHLLAIVFLISHCNPSGNIIVQWRLLVHDWLYVLFGYNLEIAATSFSLRLSELTNLYGKTTLVENKAVKASSIFSEISDKGPIPYILVVFSNGTFHAVPDQPFPIIRTTNWFLAIHEH